MFFKSSGSRIPAALRCSLIVILLIFLTPFAYATAPLTLSAAERAYLDTHKTLRLGAVAGAEPLVTLRENGKLSGIIGRVSDRVARMLDITFTLVPLDSPDAMAQAVRAGKVDLIIMPANFAPFISADIALSRPIISAGLILFYRSDCRPDELADKRCAVVRGDHPPEGVTPENVIYFDTRVDTLQAVHEGKADYGYGNEFSLAYYIGLKGYQNITTLPARSSVREYCFAVADGSAVLVSALDKALAQVDTTEMQTIILESSVIPDAPIALSDVFHQYGDELLLLLVALLLALIAILMYIRRANRALKLRNIRLLALAEISGELVFEYEVATDSLLLSRKFQTVFDIPPRSPSHSKGDVAGMLQIDEVLRRKLTGEEITLPDNRCYKAMYSYIYQGGTAPAYLVGKLADISMEKARLEALTNKARLDSLTGLLNAAECRHAAAARVQTLPAGQSDALIILDVDCFKQINDTYGHYAGDQILTQIAQRLRGAFRSHDIVGRLGGDEFMVYVYAVDRAFIERKCAAIVELLRVPLQEGSNAPTSTVSVGACLIGARQPFAQAYRQADKALYRVKLAGRNGYHILSSDA